MTWTINSGRARGGPFNTKTIHQHGPEYRVALLEDGITAVPAQQAATDAFPNIKFGSYIYQPALEEWWWDDGSVSSCRVRPVTGDKRKEPQDLEE